MRTINRTLLTAVLLTGALSLAPCARAEETPDGKHPTGERGEQMRERMQGMAEKLGLSDEQKEKFKQIQQERGEKMKEIFSGSDLPREQKMEKFKAIREEYDAKIKAMLTPEQAKKWQEMQQEMRAKMTERFKQRKAGSGDSKTEK